MRRNLAVLAVVIASMIMGCADQSEKSEPVQKIQSIEKSQPTVAKISTLPDGWRVPSKEELMDEERDGSSALEQHG